MNFERTTFDRMCSLRFVSNFSFYSLCCTLLQIKVI